MLNALLDFAHLYNCQVDGKCPICSCPSTQIDPAVLQNMRAFHDNVYALFNSF